MKPWRGVRRIVHKRSHDAGFVVCLVDDIRDCAGDYHIDVPYYLDLKIQKLNKQLKINISILLFKLRVFRNNKNENNENN